MTIKQHPAYLYAVALVNDDIARGVEGVDHPVNAWVRAQAQEFLDVCDGKDKKYCINEKKLRKIGKLMKLMQMPSGLVAGKSIYEATSGYQWLFYAAVLCVVYRNDLKRRRYETAVLEICRKNFKTFTVAVCFLLLMLTEPRFAKLFSVAPDGALSREVQKAIKEILRSSSALMPPDDPNKYFKILRDKITFKLKDTEYTPLNYSNSRLDGRLPNVFLVDEAGALPNPYAIEAMRSGQLTILNKLGCIISTKYPRSDNPFEDEVAYAKNVLEGRVQNEALFALLFEPEESIQKQWATNNNVLAQGNPAALTLPTVWEDLLNRRQKAVEQESTRENFLCKHCNIIYQGAGTESYIPIDVVQACRVDDIQWAGCEVYLGVDLSMSNDNCAVAMVGLIGDRIAARVMGFIPADKVDEKTSLEKFDYRMAVRNGECIACGDRTVDYGTIENWVFDLEETYGVRVQGVAYDRYNALSSAQKWERGRYREEGKPHDGYETVQVRQHSDTLHPATKFLQEICESGRFAYQKNKLLEVNFENARCTYDTNMNRYVTKKRSLGKVDMVVALINAIYLLQQEVLLDEDDGWVCQTV